MYLLTAYNGDTTKGLSSMGSGNNWQQSLRKSICVFRHDDKISKSGRLFIFQKKKED